MPTGSAKPCGKTRAKQTAEILAEALLPEGKRLANPFYYDGRTEAAEALGMTRTKASDVVKALVFLLRMAQDRDNGKPKGRGFLHLLARQFDRETETPGAPAAGGLILPGR